MKYRKKPVVIDAVNTSEIIIALRNKQFDLVPDWVKEAMDKGILEFSDFMGTVHTLEGHMTAWHPDMLIRGVKGEIYPCKPDIFEATYEPAELEKQGTEKGGA